MAPKWDPFIALPITTPNSEVIFCTGRSRGRDGTRCRWRINRNACKEIVNLLHVISMESPEDAEDFLPELAELSLCDDYHKDQIQDVVEDWSAIIEPIARLYNMAETSEKEKAQLEQRLASCDKDCKEKKLEIESLLLRLSEARKSASQLESDIGDAKLKIEYHSTQRETVQAQLSAERERSLVRELRLEKVRMEKATVLDRAKQSGRESYTRDVQYKAETEKQKLALEEIQADLHTQRKKSEQLQCGIDKANTQRNALAAELEQSQNALKAMKLELLNSVSTVASLKLDNEALRVTHSAEMSRLRQRIFHHESRWLFIFENIARGWLTRITGRLTYGVATVKRFFS